jgi:hypothetical protein
MPNSQVVIRIKLVYMNAHVLRHDGYEIGRSRIRTPVQVVFLLNEGRVTFIGVIVTDDSDLRRMDDRQVAVVRIDPEVCAVREVRICFDDELIALSWGSKIRQHTLRALASNK